MKTTNSNLKNFLAENIKLRRLGLWALLSVLAAGCMDDPRNHYGPYSPDYYPEMPDSFSWAKPQEKVGVAAGPEKMQLCSAEPGRDQSIIFYETYP